MSHKSRKLNYDEMIININKKKELLYNAQNAFQELTDYSDNVVVYYNETIYKDKKKAIEIEKQLLTNHKKNTIHFHKPLFHVLSSDIISCLTTIDYTCDIVEQTMLEKVTIKGVNMDALIADLNKNGMQVNKLLDEMEKHNLNLDEIQDYLIKNHIDVAKVMIILNRHDVTMARLLQNSYIRNMIKQSSYAWFCGDDKMTEKPSTKKKVTKRLVCYAIYKIKPELIVLSMNWNTVKI